MLKLKWFALLCSIPLLMVAGCAKENQPDQDLQVDPDSETIALADAIKALDNVMQMTAKTKSALERSFSEENITVIGKNALSVATKSAETDFIPDTLMYLVNFDNNQGFAIMAGDRRLGEDVYCITEYGSLSAGDFSEAFASISANRHSGADDEECIEAGYRIVPSIILSAMMSDLVYGKRESVSETKASGGNTYGPFLQTKWSQGQDFARVNLWNKYTPNNYPAGCVAIATAQLMLYNRVPADTYFDGKQCSWTEMEKVCNGKFYNTLYFFGTDEQRDQVAHFVYEIGKRHNCYIRYGEDASSGWADGAKRTLNN
ncbi:MAG: Spi family protease inhibitor, partial [Bacteroidales bacterium]|nr:Spi family protease inhibitor [Bacteroidales bacterium]